MAWKNYNYMYGRKKGNKYNNKKIEVDGLLFDSKREARRYNELKFMERAGEITDLARQVKFVLIPAQRKADTIGPRGGVHKGELLEHECAYIADFVYKHIGTGETIVEDTKGMKTADYIIKRKLMLWRYGIQIREI